MTDQSLPRLLDPVTIKKEFFSGENMPKLNLAAVYNLFKREDFPSVKIGRKWFVSTPLFLKWLEEQALNKG